MQSAIGLKGPMCREQYRLKACEKEALRKYMYLRERNSCTSGKFKHAPDFSSVRFPTQDMTYPGL